MFKRIAITTAALAVSLTAAAPSIASSAHPTHAKVDSVLVGESKADVTKTLGQGAALSHGHNRYGDRLWKSYKVDSTHAAIVEYLRANNAPRFVVIDKKWCDSSSGTLSCS